MVARLTSGSPARLIAGFAAPLLVGTIVQQLYTFCDALVVGRALGEDAFAAIGSTVSLSFLITGFLWGLSIGITIPTAQRFGAGDLPAMRRSVVTALAISLGLGVVLTAVFVPLCGTLIAAMNTPVNIRHDATTFLAVMLSALTATAASGVLANVIRALGDSRTPTVFLAASSILNIGLDVAFVVGFGWGVAGAALATVISQLTIVIGFIIFIRLRIPELRFGAGEWRPQHGDISIHLRLGLTTAFQMSIVSLGNAALQRALNSLGSGAVAAFTAASRIDQLAISPLTCFGTAISVFAAQNYGAHLYDRVRRGMRQCIVMSCSVAILLGGMNILAGPLFVRLFISDPGHELVHRAHLYLIWSGYTYILLALIFLWRGALQGLSRMAAPFCSGIMELAARIVVAALLVGPLGFTGVALASPLAWLGADIPLLIDWIRARRLLIRASAAQRTEALTLLPAHASS